MKKSRKGLLLLLPVLVCVLFTGVYIALIVLPRDHKAPAIHVGQEVLDVSVSSDESVWLQGVTATDDKDGDVTASLVVEGVSTIRKDHTATVTYAAFDRAGNVTKATRTLRYMDYESPRLSLNKPLVFSSTSSQDVLSLVSAQDPVDGDISDQVKGTLVSATNSLNTVGVHQVEFRVTNSFGDTTHVTLPVDVYEPGTYNASVGLTDYLIYLEPGADFRPEAFLESMMVNSTSYSLANQNPVNTGTVTSGQDVRVYINRYVNPASVTEGNVLIVNVKMEDDVNTDVPGTYSVAYTVNLEDNYVGFARLNVVVEE